MIFNYTPMTLKKNTTNILIQSLIVAVMATGLCATAQQPTLQEHTICTSTGQKLMLVRRSLDNQIKYFFTFGKLAKQTIDVTEYAISKIDGVASPLWLAQNQLTKLQYQKTQDLGYYQKAGVMQKKCLPTRSYLYRSITHSSLSQYKMAWKDLKQNFHIKYRLKGLQEIHSKQPIKTKYRLGKDWTLQLTGKTQGTTHMTVKN